eukprot:11374492-Alexandrium_andersonii.AAC.1
MRDRLCVYSVDVGSGPGQKREPSQFANLARQHRYNEDQRNRAKRGAPHAVGVEPVRFSGYADA